MKLNSQLHNFPSLTREHNMKLLADSGLGVEQQDSTCLFAFNYVN